MPVNKTILAVGAHYDDCPVGIPEWLGELMAFVRNRPYDARAAEPAQTTKETLARYRGLASGVRYAEAVWAAGAYPREVF